MERKGKIKKEEENEWMKNGKGNSEYFGTDGED